MSNDYKWFLDLLKENDQNFENYANSSGAVGEALTLRNEETSPQSGEAWNVILTPRDYARTVVPAIKADAGWYVHPRCTNGSNVVTNSQAFPVSRLTEAPTTNPKEN